MLQKWLPAQAACIKKNWRDQGLTSRSTVLLSLAARVTFCSWCLFARISHGRRRSCNRRSRPLISNLRRPGDRKEGLLWKRVHIPSMDSCCNFHGQHELPLAQKISRERQPSGVATHSTRRLVLSDWVDIVRGGSLVDDRDGLCREPLPSQGGDSGSRFDRA